LRREEVNVGEVVLDGDDSYCSSNSLISNRLES
jgi:hypothetical protein